MNQYWDWLDTVFIPTIRVNRWYNDAPPTNLSGKQKEISCLSLFY